MTITLMQTAETMRYILN